jgi:RimJ/RimL family protein N-acetyltransferase
MGLINWMNLNDSEQPGKLPKYFMMQHSNRLILDKPLPDDFNRFYEINSDPQTNLFNPAGPMNLEKAEQDFNRMMTHWNTHHFGTWAIKLKESGKIIGFGGLTYRMYGDELKLNLGYRFDKDAWGQGYATELSLYTISYGFSELGIDRIFALVRPKHAVSIKVLEKSNMKLSGTLNDVPGEDESLVYIIEK